MLVNSRSQKEISEKLKKMLQQKFHLTAAEANNLASFLSPGGHGHSVDGFSSFILENTQEDPYQSLANLRFPAFIDAVFKKVSVLSYEAAKHDKEFQELISEVVRIDRELVYSKSIGSISSLYDGNLLAVQDMPHVFYCHKPNKTYLRSEVAVENIFPHPYFLKLVQQVFRPGYYDNKPLYMLLSQVLGKLVQAEQPYLKAWSLYPKTKGLEYGFIMQAPDGHHKQYFKMTENMINEYIVAGVLNRLGIKMAETSLISTQQGNVLLMTQGLDRHYQKNGQKKIKSFTMFASKDQLQLDLSKGAAKISFAKLLLAVLMLGLSDVGYHGDNSGILISKMNNKKKVKLGIVDYLVKVRDQSVLTFQDLKFKLSQLPNMSPLFKDLYQQLSDEDLQQAIEQLCSPRCYHYNDKRYFVTEDQRRQSYEEAITQAFQESFTQLRSLNLLTITTQADLEQQKNIIISNFRQLDNLRQKFSHNKQETRFFSVPHIPSKH